MSTLRVALLRPVAPGLVLALLTALFGFGLGIAFGANEEGLQAILSASAQAVSDTVYQGDADKMQAITSKSWTYFKRAHMHAGALGTFALSASLLLAFLSRVPTGARAATSGLMGAGALGYSVFWLWAGLRAPSLGSTGAAKESLAWLAMPSSGAVVVGTALTLALLTWELARKEP